MRNSD
jgi:hypothetical protein